MSYEYKLSVKNIETDETVITVTTSSEESLLEELGKVDAAIGKNKEKVCFVCGKPTLKSMAIQDSPDDYHDEYVCQDCKDHNREADDEVPTVLDMAELKQR